MRMQECLRYVGWLATGLDRFGVYFLWRAIAVLGYLSPDAA